MSAGKVNGDSEPTRRDFLTQEERSARMRLIKSTGTKPEQQLADLLTQRGICFQPRRDDLPGKPDFVLTDVPVAVFVDGEFWHGKDYAAWEHKLSP